MSVLMWTDVANAARATFPAIFAELPKWIRDPTHYFVAAGLRNQITGPCDLAAITDR
jgi:hypothetical protein